MTVGPLFYEALMLNIILHITGGTGIAQAMTLSFGGLQFSAGLFEFAANPASLHTSVTFRHIHLYKGIFINVSVIINDHTGHAEKLFVQAKGNVKTPLYACEAGCQYEPVELRYVMQYSRLSG